MLRESSTDEHENEASHSKVAAGKQRWDKPKVHRLQIEETASSSGSGGDGLGRATGGGGIPGG